eukprot:g48451.t1
MPRAPHSIGRRWQARASRIVGPSNAEQRERFKRVKRVFFLYSFIWHGSWIITVTARVWNIVGEIAHYTSWTSYMQGYNFLEGVISATMGTISLAGFVLLIHQFEKEHAAAFQRRAVCQENQAGGNRPVEQKIANPIPGNKQSGVSYYSFSFSSASESLPSSQQVAVARGASKHSSKGESSKDSYVRHGSHGDGDVLPSGGKIEMMEWVGGVASVVNTYEWEGGAPAVVNPVSCSEGKVRSVPSKLRSPSSSAVPHQMSYYPSARAVSPSGPRAGPVPTSSGKRYPHQPDMPRGLTQTIYTYVDSDDLHDVYSNVQTTQTKSGPPLQPLHRSASNGNADRSSQPLHYSGPPLQVIDLHAWPQVEDWIPSRSASRSENASNSWASNSHSSALVSSSENECTFENTANVLSVRRSMDMTEPFGQAFDLSPDGVHLVDMDK